jgi:hypothetical protein
LVLHGIAVADVTVVRNAGNAILLFGVAGIDGRVTIQGQFASGGKVTTVEFDDGTVWTDQTILANAVSNDGSIVTHYGTAGADDIVGTVEDDVIDGRGGADILRGGNGNDTYHFAQGSGDDTIVEGNGDAGNGDRVKLTGLNASDVELTRLGNDLFLKILASGETLKIEGQFNGDVGVEQITFADNTVWDRSRIQAESWIRGTAGDDGFGLKVRLCIFLVAGTIAAIMPKAGYGGDFDIASSERITLYRISHLAVPSDVRFAVDIDVSSFSDEVLRNFLVLHPLDVVSQKLAIAPEFALLRAKLNRDFLGATLPAWCVLDPVRVSHEIAAALQARAPQQHGGWNGSITAVFPFDQRPPMEFVVFHQGSPRYGLHICEAALAGAERMVGDVENNNRSYGGQYQQASEEGYQPRPASYDARPFEHLPVNFRSIGFGVLLLSAFLVCGGVWFLIFGIRGKDSALSVVSGVVLLIVGVAFAWWGWFALLSPPASFSPAHLPPSIPTAESTIFPPILPVRVLGPQYTPERTLQKTSRA